MMLRVLSLSLVLFSCLPGETDLEGRPCPCVESYVCDTATNTCTRFLDAGEDAAADVPRDQGVRDEDASQGRDAGPSTDAGGEDAGGDDAGGDDAGDDAGRDAGADSGPADGGPPPDVFDAGPPPTFCERHGAGSYACLDFDETPPSTWSQNTAGSASLQFDSSRVISGRSLRIRVGEDELANYSRRAGPASTGTMWLRVRAYVEDTTNIDYIALFSVNQLLSPPYSYTTFSMSNGNARVRAILASGGMDAAQPALVPLPAGEWTCLELQIPIGNARDMVSFLNGSEIGRVSVNSSGNWDRVTVGPDSTGATQVRRTIWLDDFVWSSSRVPCNLE